jgi:outer membrane receptor for ferrienterochelin and colicins
MRRIFMNTRAVAASGLVLLISASAPNSAFAQESCARLIAEANDAYSNGQLDAVLQRTTTCLDRRPSSSERESIFMLQTRVFLAQDDMTQAQDAARRLLQVNPDFTPAVDDPERFRTLVMTIKRELAREGVSSVSKMTESVPEAPATVIVVTGEQIRQRGYQDLEAVLHDLPGFDISRINGQSYSNVYQRGYRSNATNRTLFLVDGVEQNDLHSNIAYISRQYPLSDIDRIEVVYGPASTMYGANAFLGVINVLTLDPDDMTEGKALAGDVRVGGGSWSTKSIDGTVAGRFRRASFSLTGRLFRSDDWDLSGFKEWQYPFGIGPYDKWRYFNTYNRLSDGKEVDAESEAIRLDRMALQSWNGANVGYTDLTDDWMVSGKFKINDFLFGLQMWQTREGAASASTKWAEPGARNGNIWSPRQTSFYVRYSTALSGSLRLSYFGQAKVHEIHPESSAFLLQSYASGSLGLVELVNEKPAFWAQTRLEQSSNQWRNEVNVVYRGRRNLSVLGGIDFRYGSMQTDYSRASNCVEETRSQTVFVSPRFDPLQMLVTGGAGMSDVDKNFYYWPVILGIYRQAPKFLESESDRRGCSLPTYQAPDEPSQAGEHVAVRDFGALGQVSFTPATDVKLVAAWRIDNGHASVGRSYGTVATPRLAVVYSPRQFVFKAIYAEAFKDPAPLERFSTDPLGTRSAATSLGPEHVNSIEASASHQGESHAIDINVYRATYKDVIAIKEDGLYAPLNERFNNFSDKLAEQWYFTLCGLEQCFIDALRQIPDPDDRRLLVEQFFDFFVSERAYENSVTPLRVWGSQLNASWRVRGIEVFGNYSYTHPEFTEESARSLQVGAIARHQGTLGIGGGWRSLSGSVRVNIAGARNLEPLSRGVVPYLQSQGNRVRYADPISASVSREIDPYAVANAAVTYQFIPGLAVQTTINNIFNTSYAHPGIQDADNERFAAQVPQPGRSAFIRLLTRF